jgi:hypothetical protein
VVRTALSILLIAAGLTAAFVSGRLQRDLSHTNDFIVLFPLEIIGVLVAGVIAVRVRAPLPVALYLLVISAAIATVFPLWLPEDDTILGSALLAGVLAAVGAALSLNRWAVPGGGLAFITVTASGWVAPLAHLYLAVVSVSLFIAYVLWRVRPERRTVLWVVAASVFTAVVVVLRGPDDWASASTSVKLYSFPVLLIALGVSILLDAHARSVPGLGRSTS